MPESMDGLARPPVPGTCPVTFDERLSDSDQP